MSLLVDLFGYLGILLHGLVIVSQSMALGGALFLVLVARPFETLLGPDIARRCARIAGYSALALVAVELVNVALQAAVLVNTIGLTLSNVLSADFALAGMLKTASAAVLAALLLRSRPAATPAWALLTTGTIELIAATLTTHAAARLFRTLCPAGLLCHKLKHTFETFRDQNVLSVRLMIANLVLAV